MTALARYLRELVRKTLDAKAPIRHDYYMDQATRHEVAARNATNTVDFNFHKAMAAMWRRLAV